jgi:hypothetical protein
MVITDLGNGLVCVEGYRYEVQKEKLDDPDTIDFVTVTLPQGLSAKFRRWTAWKAESIQKRRSNELPAALRIGSDQLIAESPEVIT